MSYSVLKIPHRCDLPPVKDFLVGTIIQCYQCKKKYRLRSIDGGRYWRRKYV